MKVKMKPGATREFDSLSYPVQAQVLSVFKRLAKWPSVSGWKPMRREWSGHARIRAGDWRVIFKLPLPDDEEVWVAKIGHRSTIYDD